MKYFLQFVSSVAICVVVTTGCSIPGKINVKEQQATISQLHFLDEYDLPNALQYKGTTIGGLSGIDYDKKRDVYYLISDDRSAINPARFYTARIHIKEKKIDSIEFIGVTSLLNNNGKVYPNSSQDPYHVPDPEDIRFNPLTDELVWSSEGERIVKPGTTILEDPAITLIKNDGSYIDSFAVPANMRMSTKEKGPRQNSVFEGISFADNYKMLFASVEEPIYEDGPKAGTGDSTGWVRLIKFDVESKKPVAQYAYRIESIPNPAIPANAYKINGVSDILYIGNNKLLVIERAFSTGRLACTIRLFIADLDGAEDISGANSILTKRDLKPVSKKLILNMNDLGRYIDNVEGVTFGPRLPNGHHTLIFVVDDNFSRLEKMQFFLFEIIP